jgi:multidrug resistance efflux pump
VIVAAVTVVSLLELAAFTGTYLSFTRYFVSTDNAQVDADQIDINAPTAGTVSGWAIDQGATVRTHQVVGFITGTGSGGQPKRPVRSPGAGQVSVNTVVNGQYVAAGTTLAVAYSPASTYVTARVKETDIAAVYLGQQAEVLLDAYPGKPLYGTVSDIRFATASESDPWPSADTDPTNPQKVDQYIPVKILVTDNPGEPLLPGMNASVRIHR